MEPLRLALFQFSPVLGDVEANAARIASCATETRADLLLTPELSLTGYDLGDDAHHVARPVRIGERLSGAGALDRASVDIIAGIAERGDDSLPYNALVVLRAGVVRHRHRKVYLPTYGMFDEGRFWGRGRTVEPWQRGDWSVGLLVCEDFWHPGLVYALATSGMDVLLVAAAAPGRGVREDMGEAGRFASADAWQRIAQTTAQLYGIFVVLANRSGVEGGVTFAGGSLIVGPDGAILASADSEDGAVLELELTGDALARARRPYAHGRDDDPSIVIDALARVCATHRE
jgi:predicted amidohydrolase